MQLSKRIMNSLRIRGLPVVLISLVVLISTCSSQRVAPGVPPQHYDPNAYQQPPQYAGQGHGHPPPPPPPQQYQQVPVQQQQHQQVPIQQQHQQVPVQHQVPVQQHQGQPPVQHHGPPAHHQPQGVPVQQVPHGHHSPHHGQTQPILDTSNIGQERQHIQEHMDVPIDTSQMSEQELQFHYFKMHDTDGNNKLDGCELVKSLIHWHENEGAEEHARVVEDNQIAEVVDQVLDYDVNQDGMIDYAEFMSAQNLAQKNNQKKKCETCGD